jgi:hypothetical protein
LEANCLEEKQANLKADESISLDIHDLEHPVKQHVTHSGLSTRKKECDSEYAV